MITGSIVAMVTPMVSESMAVDWGGLKNLVEWHIEQGTDAIGAVGTTGESATLDVEEHLEVIRVCVEQARGRVPVLAGTGANSTQEAISLTRGATEAGADACLLVTPYYNKPTQEGLYRHFKAIAEAVPIPQVLYNVPGRTACDLQTETTVRLSQIPNIVGIKDATGNMQRGAELIRQCSPDFAVYSGDDATALELMLMGGRGNISVTANIAPRAMHDLCEAALGGNADLARSINDRLAELNRMLFIESNPIPVKWAVAELGLAQPDAIRLPLTPLSLSLREELRAAMVRAGLL